MEKKVNTLEELMTVVSDLITRLEALEGKILDNKPKKNHESVILAGVPKQYREIIQARRGEE